MPRPIYRTRIVGGVTYQLPSPPEAEIKCLPARPYLALYPVTVRARWWAFGALPTCDRGESPYVDQEGG